MPWITQRELAEYTELKEECQAMKYRLDRERERLLALLKAGIKIEPGSLGARVKVYEEQRVNKATLIGMYGERWYEQTRQGTAPTTVEQLVVARL